MIPTNDKHSIYVLENTSCDEYIHFVFNIKTKRYEQDKPCISTQYIEADSPMLTLRLEVDLTPMEN